MNEVIQAAQDSIDNYSLVLFIWSHSMAFLGGAFMALCWSLRKDLKKLEDDLNRPAQNMAESEE